MFPVHRQYKYQINIDGTVAAYRLPYLLAGDSVVLKLDSIYYEHFYNELRPWEHYVPVRADLGDLLEKIQWARQNDEQVSSSGLCNSYTTFVASVSLLAFFVVVCFSQVRKIALAGQQFARNHLMGDKIFCYYFKLFQVISCPVAGVDDGRCWQVSSPCAF